MEDRLLKNARIVVEISCRVKANESVLILTKLREPEGRRWHYSRALGSAAAELGAMPVVMDLAHYTLTQSYRDGRILKPLKAAIESADVVIADNLNYADILGDPDMHDLSLTAEQRRVYLQNNGMEEWEITPEEVAAIRKRTMWLLALLDSSEKVHVSSPAGTDFSFGLGQGANWLPILGIVPLYGEVAVIPQQKSGSGVFVVDGPTQMDVRTKDELDREPLRITIDAGRVKDISGDPVQTQRLKEFISSGDPPAETIDEVGIITTSIKANDKYWWRDGTHHHDTVHIALGNNQRRDTLVHGPRHMDGEVCRPTISVDGMVIVRDGVFLDDVMALPPATHD
jgi:leucyl aminopeptidase (aminopeptidase T)